MKKNKYSVIIQWSDEDEVYVVTLPEWGGCHTHGSTYEEAAKNAREVLEMLIEGEEKAGLSLPPSHEFMYPGPSGFTYELNHLVPAITQKAAVDPEVETLLDDLASAGSPTKQKSIRAKLRNKGHRGGLGGRANSKLTARK